MPGDFLKPLLISWIESNMRTIHLTAMENTLMSKQNQHHIQKNCLGNLCIVHMRSDKAEGLPYL